MILKHHADATILWRHPSSLWAAIEDHRAMLETSGSLKTQRSEQSTRWMWALIEERLFRAFREHPDVASELGATVEAVRSGSLPPGAAATRLLGLFGSD